MSVSSPRLRFRLALVLAAFTACPVLAQDQEVTNRFGFLVNLEIYPQSTPQTALKSFLKAYDNQKLNYLLAHLVDPKFVDDKVADYLKYFPSGSKEGRTILAFNKLAKETREHFLEEPQLLTELRVFADKAEWDMGDDKAVGTVKGLGGRQVNMRRYLGRWFFENKRAVAAPKK